MIENIGKLWFPNRTNILRKRLTIAGYTVPPYHAFGWFTIVLTLVAIAWSFLMVFRVIGAEVYGIYSILVLVFFTAFSLVVLFIAGYIIARIGVEVRIYQRVTRIEKHLSDYLREFSTNLRAGEEFVDAFERASSSEFGPIDSDVKRMVIEIRGGEQVTKVLAEYAAKYDSYLIEETFSVIKEAYEGGGGLAPILDRIAEHIDVIDHLKKEAVASISNYLIFMTVVSVVIAPILFALSYNLLDLIQTLLRRVVTGAGSAQVLPVFVTRFNVSLPDFIAFSRICIAVIAGSAAAIIGITRTGNLRGAPSLVIMYTIIALIIYQLSLIAFTAFFGALFVI
jgi:hypothetical protein